MDTLIVDIKPHASFKQYAGIETDKVIDTKGIH
jgi:hypothetical protein